MTDTPTPSRDDLAAPAGVSRQSAQTISDQLFEIGDAFTSDLIQAGADPQIGRECRREHDAARGLGYRWKREDRGGEG